MNWEIGKVYDKERLTRCKRRNLVRELKNKPCKDCNIKYPYYVMDFDHLEEKNFTMSKVGKRRLDVIIHEASNCDVVCSNCHRIRTWKRSYKLPIN